MRLPLWVVTVLAVFLLVDGSVGARPAPLPPVVGADGVRIVAAGDTLYTLARGAALGLEHVAQANGLPLRLDLPLGAVVTLPTRRILPERPPANGIVLNIPERGLYLFLQGRYVGFYPVAVGRLGFLTPRGQFRVVEKVRNPTWVPPSWANERAPVGPGPTNPLGDRWIGTSAPRVGIHGTQSPYSIGMCISHGCIRMYPEHVRALFEVVSLGMTVRFDYETAKVGMDGRSGAAYLVTFPDVYHLRDPFAEALRKVAGVGLLGRVRPEAVRERGGEWFRVVPLEGAEFIVRMNGRQLALPIDPIVRGRRLWLPVDVLAGLGLRVCSVEGGMLEVRRGGDQMRLRVRDGRPSMDDPDDSRGEVGAGPDGKPVRRIVLRDDDIASTACRWRGRVYVLADDVLDFFAMKREWRVTEHTLVVTSGEGAGESSTGE